MLKTIIKTAFVLSVMIFSAQLCSAEQPGDVIVRFSRQDEASARIVLEGGEPLIKSAAVIATPSQIKVEFSGNLEVKKQKDFPYDLVKSGRVITVVMKDVTDVRAYKLTDPPRIVFHIKATAKNPPALPGPQTAQKSQSAGTQAPSEAKKSLSAEQRSEKKQKISGIVLDPGHGGYDFGITDGQTREKDISLSAARSLSDMLSKNGYKPYLLRKTDQHISIHDRIQLANSKKPDLLISIHSSASDSFIITTAAADETQADAALKLYGLAWRQLRHIDRSRAFAKILAEVLKGDYETDVSVQELPLPLLTSLDALAVLIEYPSFKSSEYDQKAMEHLSETIVKAISAYEQ